MKLDQLFLEAGGVLDAASQQTRSTAGPSRPPTGRALPLIAVAAAVALVATGVWLATRPDRRTSRVAPSAGTVAAGPFVFVPEGATITYAWPADPPRNGQVVGSVITPEGLAHHFFVGRSAEDAFVVPHLDRGHRLRLSCEGRAAAGPSDFGDVDVLVPPGWTSLGAGPATNGSSITFNVEVGTTTLWGAHLSQIAHGPLGVIGTGRGPLTKVKVGPDDGWVDPAAGDLVWVHEGYALRLNASQAAPDQLLAVARSVHMTSWDEVMRRTTNTVAPSLLPEASSDPVEREPCPTGRRLTIAVVAQPAGQTTQPAGRTPTSVEK